jgi:hypothetical protein
MNQDTYFWTYHKHLANFKLERLDKFESFVQANVLSKREKNYCWLE